MLRPEPLDIVLILIVAALIFGANRLPETARALGKGIREFRDAVTGKDAAKTHDASDATGDSHRDSN